MVGKGPGLDGQEGSLRGGRETGTPGGRDERRTRRSGRTFAGVAGNFLLPRRSLFSLFAWLQITQPMSLSFEGKILLK